MTASDTFDRANSTTTLGTSSGGQVWTAHRGTWGINTNNGYCATNHASSVNFASVDAGFADGSVEVTIAVTGSNQPGLCFRTTDSNNTYLLEGGTGAATAKFHKIVGGTVTTISNSGSNIQFVTGDVIRVDMSGSSYSFYRNGVQIFTGSDSTFTTQTRHGLYHVGATTGSRFDNFSTGDGTSTEARLDAVYVQALVNGTPEARLDAVYIQTLVNGTPEARLDAVHVQVLIATPVAQAAVGNSAGISTTAVASAGVGNPAGISADIPSVVAVGNSAGIDTSAIPAAGVGNPAGIEVEPPSDAPVAGVGFTPGIATTPITGVGVGNPAGIETTTPMPEVAVGNSAGIDTMVHEFVTGESAFTFEGHAADPIVTTFVEGASSFTFEGHADAPGDGEYVTGSSYFTFNGHGRAAFPVTFNPATLLPDYRLILVESDGTHRKQLVDAVMGDRDWVLGGRGGFTFTIPRTSPNASLVKQYDQVQIWVGAEMLPEAWFYIVDPVKDAGPDLQFSCSGLRWLLENERIGKERPNLLANGGFEDNLKHWSGAWYPGSASEAPPVMSIVTGANALDGGKALQVEAVESVIVRETETAAVFKGNRPYAWDSPQSDGYLSGGPAIVLGLVEDFAEDAVLTIEGFTADVDGGDGLELSQRRANLAKATILAEHPDMTITAIGRGETIQVASNATPAGQAKNRRIVITGTSTRVGHRQATVRWLTYMVPTTERVPLPLDLDGWINLIAAVGPSKDGWGLYIDRRPAGGYADSTIIDTAHTELDPDIFPLERWTLDGTSINAPADGVTYLYNVRLYGSAGSTRFDSITLMPNLKVSWYNVHHSVAIGNLVDHAQDPAFGKVDLLIENQCGPFGRIDDFEYRWKDHIVVDDAIDEILRADDAPDFWIATTPDRRIAKTAARRGSHTGMVFTYGENVASYTSTVAGDKVATTAFAVSNGTEGGGRAEAVYRTGAVNGLVLERLETTGPNLYPARLRERAKAQTRYGRSDVITSLTLKSSATAGLIGVLTPGDTITARVNDGGLDADGDYRIIGIKHSFARNQLTFDVVPEV